MTLVRQTIRQLLDRIRADRLLVGDPLPAEARLAETLGVSRTVVREAVAALSALGVLDVANGRRPRVAPLGPFPMTVAVDHALATGQITFNQVWDVRRRLETGSAALAAIHRDTEGAVRLGVLARAMRDAVPDIAELARLDIDFHREVARASGNLLFEQIIPAFAPLMRTTVPQAWGILADRAGRLAMVDQHVLIAGAIADRDPRAAEAAMDRHFDQSITTLLAARASQADAPL